MLLSDSKYLHIFLIRIHFKGLRWHFKSLMKCYYQKFNFQCSCKAEEPSWKLTDLFLLVSNTSSLHTTAHRALRCISIMPRDKEKDAISWQLGHLVASSYCYWKTSIRNAVRNKYVLWYNAQAFFWEEWGGCTSGRKGNETQTSHTHTDAAAIKKSH